MTMAMATAAAAPRGDLLRGRRHADSRVAEWVSGLNLLPRKLNLSRRREREAMRSQGPACNEVLANVFQRLPPKSAAACRAVCIQWYVLLSSPSFADVDVDGNATTGSSACFAGLHGADAGHARRRRRRGGDTVPAAPGFPPLPRRQRRRSKKKQAFRRMF